MHESLQPHACEGSHSASHPITSQLSAGSAVIHVPPPVVTDGAVLSAVVLAAGSVVVSSCRQASLMV